MDDQSFKLSRALAEAARAAAANGLSILLAAILLVAAPMTARGYFGSTDSGSPVTVHVDLPPTQRHTAHVGAQRAGRLEPIKMRLDAGSETLAWVAPMIAAVLFDAFIVLCVLDHSARRQRSARQRLWRALVCLPSLVLIHLFWILSVLVGLFVLVLPAAAVVAGLAAAGPARLWEDLRPLPAIARSARLGWAQFWPMTLVAAAWLAVNLGVIILSPVGAGRGALASRVIALTAAPLILAALRTVGAAMSAALYIELTRHERGVEITRMETVFA